MDRPANIISRNPHVIFNKFKSHNLRVHFIVFRNDLTIYLVRDISLKYKKIPPPGLPSTHWVVGGNFEVGE
jgi:hypothetical protein